MRPYYSRDRLVHTTVTTVMRNLVEGAGLVIVLLSLFLGNLRAALIVALTIPLSLLFAFVFMDLRGIPANLLSLGAIDFGIIVDGAVIMTENILRHLSERKVTGPRVLREVQHAALEVARPLTFAVLIIMTVYVPILTFQRIEGELLRPMAVTIAFAVIGSLVLTLTLLPVLTSFLFRHPPSERESPILRALRAPYLPTLRFCLRRPAVPVGATAARRHPRHHHELLAADQGQRGRGPRRREGRARHQALRPRPLRAGGQGARDRRGAGGHPRRGRPRLRPPGGPAAAAARGGSQGDRALRHQRPGHRGRDRGGHARPGGDPGLRGGAPVRAGREARVDDGLARDAQGAHRQRAERRTNPAHAARGVRQDGGAGADPERGQPAPHRHQVGRARARHGRPGRRGNAQGRGRRAP